MKIKFKRDGRVYIGRHEVGFIWSQSIGPRGSRSGPWRFEFSGRARAGGGLLKLRESGVSRFHLRARTLRELKDDLRWIFTDGIVKVIADHCEEVERSERLTDVEVSDEEFEQWEKMSSAFVGAVSKMLGS